MNESQDNPTRTTALTAADRQRLADTVVLIPAAGRVAEGVMALSNIGCPAMVPVALATFVFDAIIQNPDRRSGNPNCLVRGDAFRI